MSSEELIVLLIYIRRCIDGHMRAGCEGSYHLRQALETVQKLIDEMELKEA